LGGGRHLSRAASAGRGALSCPLASPTIPYGATAPEAEEAAVHQTFFPPRSQIQMASLRTPVTIRQRFVRFNTHAQGSRLHPAEMISSRFCRAPEPRRSCPLCRMAGTLARKKIVPNYGVPIAPRDAAPLPAVEPPAPTAASVPPPALAIPASHSSEPKKVHTIIIRSDRSEQIDTSAAAVTHSATSPRAPGTR
jgi:hypothetical protein